MPAFPRIPDEQRLDLLKLPERPLSMVLDTDTYCEVDDQCALTYALLSTGLNVEAVYAAPFYKSGYPRSTGPADGMQKSYEEILRVLGKLGRKDRGFVFRGSESYLPSVSDAVPSPAAYDLIKKALTGRDAPLYVLAIGAITNVASALLLEPQIIPHVVVVWLGGDPYYWPRRMDWCFNLVQDVRAAQVIFDSGVPVVHVPMKNVSEHLRATLPEMQMHVRGREAIGDYLYEIFESFRPDYPGRSKTLWDITNVAYVVNPDWVPTELRPSPVLKDDLTWGPVDPTRHLVREALDVNRDAIFADFFGKLQAHADRGTAGP